MKKKLKFKKKGQVWSLDLIIAAVIFLIGIIILYNYAINYSTQSKNNLDELLYEGNLASELILSEEDFGILSKGIVNQTKLDAFDALSDSGKKSVLGVEYNFYFTMDQLEIDRITRDYVGIINSSQVDNLVKITRLTVYKNKPVKFQLYAWA